MKTTLERLDPTRVKLLVEVEPERVSEAFDEAARHLAQQVQVKGFRKGKVPRRLLEARIGKGAIAQHAIEDHLSTYYAEAVRQEDLVPVAPPEIDLRSFTEEEGATFEATVEVRPEIDLPDHEGIQVTFPDWEVSAAEVDRYLDDLRDRFAELEEVDRPAAIGDFVTIDLSVFRDGEPIEAATAEDALYEVGSGGVTPKLDEELPGAVAGHILSYTDRLPQQYPEHGGEDVEFRVLVKDVRAKQLPDLDDDFAEVASEFDTLDELREDVRANLERARIRHARQELRGRILEAYLALVEVPLPEGMVEAEREARLEDLRRQAERYGMELEQLLELRGTDLQTVERDADEQARTAVKAQLTLEAVAEKQGLTAESADVEIELRRHAAIHDVEPARLARIISEQGSLGVLVGDVIRRKALDVLVEAAEVDGAPTEEQLAALGPLEPVAGEAEPGEHAGIPEPEAAG